MTDDAQIWLFQAIVEGAPGAIIAADPEASSGCGTRAPRPSSATEPMKPWARGST